MLTTLSIISLDQGKIWKDCCPLPPDGAATEPEGVPEPVGRRWFPSTLPGRIARLVAAASWA
jgi:hypothetical protein